jgi:UDP-N-acetylmuramyl pentapeptide phosphotransferase/UDP-N-acetylglucosamine-1-phosphate transferase
MSSAVILAALLFAGAAIATWFAVKLLLPWLIAWEMMDRPNSRSSHRQPVPRGGGLGIVLVLAAPVFAVAASLANEGWLLPIVVTASLLGLAALSWRDDRRSLPASLRLSVQAFAVVATLAVFPHRGLFLQGILPPWADLLVVALAWIWFINLYNFMDGIDGISGVETAAIGAGLVLVGLLAGLRAEIVWIGALYGGAAVGFLLWNWSPAKLFLGDVGSVPLGYLLGFALLLLVAQGHLAAAVILPLYYLADATSTLLWRLSRGERVWQAHREHAYQLAAAQATHAYITTRIAVLNAVLVLLAVGAAAVSSDLLRLILVIMAAAATLSLIAKFRSVQLRGAMRASAKRH